MARKPISAEVVSEGDERFVVLTYANGDVVRKHVDRNREPSRKPRRPPPRLKLSERPSKEDEASD
jgi:hypothetical protein